MALTSLASLNYQANGMVTLFLDIILAANYCSLISKQQLYCCMNHSSLGLKISL